MSKEAIEAVERAMEIIEGIALNDNQRGRADGAMLKAATLLLDTVKTDFEHPYSDCPLGSHSYKTLIYDLDRARLFGDGLIPTGLDRFGGDYSIKEITFATKGMGIKTVFLESELWVEEWLWTAYNAYKKHNGFAGLTLKRYISRMRPESEAPKKRRLFGKQIDSEETVDEEILYNVKRKIRQKAPRLKLRMGRI